MILVVGGGPAGLCAAHSLQGDFDVRVVERDGKLGGLCQSFVVEGVTFDLGGHAFFTSNAEIRDYLSGNSASPLYWQDRNAWVFSHEAFIPYPFQANLHGLPVEVVADCISGLYEAALEPDIDVGAESLAKWISRFGPGLSKHFLEPYNRKVWAYPLDRIVPEWAGNRIVTPNKKEILHGALERRSFVSFPNARVGYPERGGYAAIFDRFAEELAPVVSQGELVALDAGYRRATFKDGRCVEFDQMVSTIPLNELVQLTTDADPQMRKRGLDLHHNSLCLVSLVYELKNKPAEQRVYSADPMIPFHKLVLNSNSCPELRDAPRFGFQAEISFSLWKQIDHENVVRDVISALQRMGLVGAEDKLVATDVRTLKYAYPVYTESGIEAARSLRQWYEDRGVHCAGRFGEWLYINADGAAERGLAVASNVRRQHEAIVESPDLTSIF